MLDMPLQVRRAVNLLWFLMFAAIVAMLFEFDATTLEAGSEFASFLWPFLIGTFIFNALLIFCISRQHNWARIVLLLFTMAGAIMMFWPGLELESVSWDRWVSDIAFTVLDLIALYWLFTGPGAKWFSSRGKKAF